ncbi:hypothetical protein V8E54_003623 [Elaphomyces granulatus]
MDANLHDDRAQVYTSCANITYVPELFLLPSNLYVPLSMQLGHNGTLLLVLPSCVDANMTTGLPSHANLPRGKVQRKISATRSPQKPTLYQSTLSAQTFIGTTPSTRSFALCAGLANYPTLYSFPPQAPLSTSTPADLFLKATYSTTAIGPLSYCLADEY